MPPSRVGGMVRAYRLSPAFNPSFALDILEGKIAVC
jgi:hypothetical protein